MEFCIDVPGSVYVPVLPESGLDTIPDYRR